VVLFIDPTFRLIDMAICPYKRPRMARARHNNVGFGAADFGQHTMESFPLSREAVGRFRATAVDRMTILCRFAALALLAINDFSTAPTLAAADLHTAAG
jgi:hypothetical protein